MATPFFNEDMIASMLDTAPSIEAGEQLRTASYITLLDAYDRKVDRNTFSEVAKQAVQLNEMMGRLESTTGIYATFKADKLTPEKLEEAMAIITGHAESCRHALVEKLALIMQCPWSDDSVH